jgi:hypothetical protein
MNKYKLSGTEIIKCLLLWWIFQSLCFAAQGPLITLDKIKYDGAFRIKASTFGESSINYSVGTMCYNPKNRSIFIVGHSHHNAIGEFPVPQLSKSLKISELAMSQAPLQSFAKVIHRAPNIKKKEIGVIGGMYLFQGPATQELLVNVYEYYDAGGVVTETSLVLRDATDIAKSPIDGLFGFSAKAHAARWLSPVPAEWQSALGGSFIAGSSSGDPIISRWPVGPSAFAFDPNLIIGNAKIQDPMPVTTLLDYSLSNPIGGNKDLSNSTGSNDLWTHLTRAVYGFIIPKTRTYFVVGSTGGIKSGICYKKCNPDNGTQSGGYHSRDTSDNHFAYWMFDVEDLLKVKRGLIKPHEVMPYQYGVFPVPIPVPSKKIGGGTFDPGTGTMYITINSADREQGTYSRPPIIAAYHFDLSLEIDSGKKRERPGQNHRYLKILSTEKGRFTILPRRNLPRKISISIHDTRGRLIHKTAWHSSETGAPKTIQLPKENLSWTLHLIKVTSDDFREIHKIAGVGL